MTAPRRLVSLTPSITELIWWLGRGDALVGRTRFCTEPAEMSAAVPAMGGTKDPDTAAIVAARPELVIVNHEENRREDVEALQAAGIEVLVTDPSTVRGAIAMVREIGQLLDADERAEELARATEAELAPEAETRRRVLVPMWWKPMMAMGGGTYGSDVVWHAGGINVLAERTRYPQITMDEAAALKPEVVLLPDEPFRFQERHVPEFAPIAPAKLVDGKLLWWYGPRMPAAIRALRELLRDGD